MYKKSLTIKQQINLDIQVGDKVYLIDGSGLSLNVENPKQDYYIVFAYPEITNSDLLLKEIKGEVLATNITNRVVEGVCNHCYLQDILVQIGDATFRTCSKFVKKEMEVD